jgi:glycosyltransferase involved in cell wall biosynthesis
MKILFFNEYTSIRGGTDYVVDAEINGLTERGIKNKIFQFRNTEFRDSKFNQKLSMLFSSLSGNFLLNDLQNTIEEYKPDIIHFHNIYQLFRFPVWAKINAGHGKIILHLHNYYPFCLNSFFFSKYNYCSKCYSSNSWTPGVLRKCYNNSFLQSLLSATSRLTPFEWLKKINKITKIICISRFLTELYISSGVPSEKIFTLSNPVIETRSEGEKKRDYIVYLGNIRSEKGIEIVFNAALYHKDIPFIIAGDGPDLKRHIKRYSKLNNLEFKGFVEGEVKRELLRNARYMLLPSLCNETFSIVTLEAFVLGTPVMSTGTGALKELIREGVTGRIITVRNYLEKIYRFWYEVGERHLYYEMNCKKAASYYYEDDHVNKLITIYNKVLGNDKI